MKRKRAKKQGGINLLSAIVAKNTSSDCLHQEKSPVTYSNTKMISLPDELQIAIDHYQAGRLQHAQSISQKILEIEPKYTDALHLSGVIAYRQGELDKAVELINKAINAKPTAANYYNSLGVVFKNKGKLDAAINIYQQALLIKPDYAEVYNNLGVTFKAQGKLEEEIECYRKALTLMPDYIDAHLNLGNFLKEHGEHEEALVTYEKGLALNPMNAELHNSLIFTASRGGTYDSTKIFALCKRFGQQFEAGLVHKPHRNAAIPNKCLKIGYVSGDFYHHSVHHFIEPILDNHNKQNVETFCYYNHNHIDHITKRLMDYTDHWRSIVNISDDNAEQMMRQDTIDILVDLSGHSFRNRLLLFARKPAPVQVTWIGYPVTTGLSAMDYRLTNPYIDPPGWNEKHHTEKLVRLSTSACFQPEKLLPDIEPLPALKNGYITFASFHTPDKINSTTLSLWAKILSALPDTKLLLCLDTSKDHIIKQFQLLDIGSDRLEFFCRQPIPRYLELHNKVDILLDTFPYNGGTVSRYSLLMGVPVLTLAGRSAVSRVGLALMTQLGLELFVANSEENFIINARLWAGDIEGLAKVRNTLREKMYNAPFSQPAFVVKELEAAYQKMWQHWCEQQTS